MKKLISIISQSKYILYLLLFILAIISVSLYRTLKLEEETIYEVMLFSAKNSFEKNVMLKRWTLPGEGFYLPISDYTQPNPYLNIPNKVLETKEGVKLTLVNPNYITQLIHRLERTSGSIKTKLVSLTPINPNNKPDEWETNALKEFNNGLKEKHEIQEIDNKKFLRYISPFVTEENCLNCHAQQGYKVGEINGGISVFVPYDEKKAIFEKDISNIIFFHLIAAIVSISFLFFVAYQNFNKRQKLLNSRQQILDISNAAGIGYWELDLISNKVYINEGWVQILGYNPDELSDDISAFLNLSHKDDLEKVLKILEDLNTGKIEEFSVEHRAKCKDNTYRWVLSKGRVIEKSKNQPLKVSGVQIDIDRDKKIIENIFKHQNEFKIVFNHSPIPASISRLRDGKFIAINKAWEKLSGYTTDEVIGKTSIELNIWKSPDVRAKYADEILKKGSFTDLEIEFRNKFDNILIVKIAAVVIDIENEKFIVANFQDITDQKRLERKISKQKELYSYFNKIHFQLNEINEKELYDLSIECLVSLTDSKIGFFHQVSEDQNEIILTTWNEAAKEFCTAEYKTHYPITEAGNWTDCLKTKSVCVYNDYKNSPNKKGYPVGHVEVEKFMSIATYRDGKPFLIFGVGNKESDYDEIDAQNMEIFASEISRVVEKKEYINKIQENERFVSTLIKNLPGFVYRCANDKDWTMIYLSENVEVYTGYKTKELIANQFVSYNDIILPEFQKEIWDKVQEAIQKDSPYEFEYQIVKKDGNIIWVWERGKPIKDSKGDLLFLEGFITDINEKKKLEIELIESEEKFRLIAEHTGDVISVIDMNLNYTYVSPSVKQVLGYSPEEVMQIGFVRTLLPQYQQVVQSIYFEELENEKNPNVSPYRSRIIFLQQYNAKGEIVWTENTVSFLRDKYLKPIGIVAVSRDITKRKKLEEELKESELKFRTIFEKHLIAEIIIDASTGKILDANQAALELYGYNKEEILEKTFFDLDIEPNSENYQFLLEARGNVKERFRRKHYNSNGEILDLEVFASGVKIGHKDCIHFILTDISEQEKLQRILIENERKYRKLVEEMSQGLAVHQAIYDDNGNMVDYKFIDMNRSFEKILGIKKEDYLNRTVLEVLPNTEKYWIDLYASVVKTGKPVEFENYSREFDKYFHVVAYNNLPDQFATIVTDVTEQKKLQIRIEESEMRLRRLTENARDIVFRFNVFPKRGFEFLNDVMTKISGYSKEEFLNDPELAVKIVYPDDLPKVLGINQKTEEEIKKPFVLRWITKKGDMRWIEHRLTPIYNEENQLIAIEGILRDITQRIEYETMLKDSERKFRSLFENMTSGFVLFEAVKDENGNVNDLIIVEGNKYFAEVTGLDLKEVTGERLTKALPGIEKDPANWIQAYGKVAITGEPISFENYSDLLKRYFTVSAFQSEYNRCAVTFLDITDRKKKELELNKLSLTVQQSPVSVVITDIEGNIEYVNNFFTQLTGYTLDEVKGQNPRMLSAGKHTKEYYRKLWDTIKSGQVWEGLFYNVKKNGEKFWEHAIITPIKDQNNKIINFVAVKDDITDDILKEEQLKNYRENLEKLVEQRTLELQRVNSQLLEQLEKEKILEEQLQEALNKEKELNELKTRFFASVSHEFRTPLTAVLTSTQMIQRYGKKWTEEKINSHYQNIEKQVSHLVSLLDDILLISKADREILKNEPKPQDIEELFKNLVQQYSMSLFENKNIVFQNLCANRIYNIDVKLFNHIVGNLLANSIKFSYENTDINLIVREEENNLVVEVEDKGIGIPENDLPNIFEPFYRSSNSLVYKGTGLGLNIVKRCVELMKGTISVESKLNQGTKFTIRIPQ